MNEFQKLLWMYECFFHEARRASFLRDGVAYLHVLSYLYYTHKHKWISAFVCSAHNQAPTSVVPFEINLKYVAEICAEGFTFSLSPVLLESVDLWVRNSLAGWKFGRNDFTFDGVRQQTSLTEGKQYRFVRYNSQLWDSLFVTCCTLTTLHTIES